MNPTAKKNIRGVLYHVAPGLGFVIAIFWLGSIETAVEIPQDLFAKDKATHFVVFGILQLLCLRAFRFTLGRLNQRSLVALAVVTSSTVGALLEFWQMLFPYRSSEFLDWVADTLGALIAGLVSFLWLRRRGRRPNA